MRPVIKGHEKTLKQNIFPLERLKLNDQVKHNKRIPFRKGIS